MKEEEPADGRKTEDEGIGKENLAILEKIKKNQRQDYLNVRVAQGAGGPGEQRDPRAGVLEAPASPPAPNQRGCPQPEVQQYQFSGAAGAGAEKSELPLWLREDWCLMGQFLLQQDLPQELCSHPGLRLWRWVVLLYPWAEILANREDTEVFLLQLGCCPR